jgi:peptidyl-prolyl cis-trans isomerase A (cyclophilin A)
VQASASNETRQLMKKRMPFDRTPPLRRQAKELMGGKSDDRKSSWECGLTEQALPPIHNHTSQARESHMNPATSVKWLTCCLCLAASHLTAAPKVLPVLNKPITDRHGLAGFELTVDLSKAFGTEAIDDQVVRFKSIFNAGGDPVVLDMALFSNRTPVTRTNFLNYVNDGRYVDSFIHRSVPGFVIQGGGFKVIDSNIVSVATDPPIINEFGISNTLGTISMAKLDGNPNSATSQWFISLGANSNILDPQNSGFTVFGRITKDTFEFAQTFGDPEVFPVYNYGGPFSELPLFFTHDPNAGLPRFNELILFSDVSLVPLPDGQAGESTVLEYAVISNSNPAVASATVDSQSTLKLLPQAAGTTTITIRATDSVGNTVDDSFVLSVNPTDSYATWASRATFPNGQNGIDQNPDGDSLTNLQEFAFLADPAVADQSALPVMGHTDAPPAARQLTLTFPVRKFTTGLTYAVEASNWLEDDWSTVWSSADGFAHPQVVSALDQPDRTIVTIKDTAARADSPFRFLRTRVTEE